MVLRYYASMFRHALREALGFAWSQGLPIGVAIAVIGVATGIIVWHRYPQSADSVVRMKDLIQTAIISSIVPTLIVGFAILLIYLVRAPANLADKARLAYETLEQSGRVLTERIGQLEQQATARAPDLLFTVEYWGQLMMNLGRMASGAIF